MKKIAKKVVKKTAKPTRKPVKAVKREVAKKVAMPTRKASSAALTKYRKYKKLYKLYALKKELSATGMAIPYSAGDEVKLIKYKARMTKSRKLAAPELIKAVRAKRAAFGRGKKRGGVGGGLSRLRS